MYIGIHHETKEFIDSKARAEGIKPAEYVRRILVKYQKVYSKFEEEGSHITPREVIRTLYDVISEDRKEDVVKSIYDYGEYYLRSNSDDLSFLRMLRSLINWFRIRGLTLDYSKINKTNWRFTCKHDLGKNWSEIIMEVSIKLLILSGCENPCKQTHNSTYFQFDIAVPKE